jgi:hypothetical protein
MSSPEDHPLILALSYNFYGAGASLLLENLSVLGVYLRRTAEALSIPEDSSLFWAPCVLISILRYVERLEDSMIKQIMKLMIPVFKIGDPEIAMWVLYFLFKQNGDNCTRLAKYEFIKMIANALCSENELIVRIGLFITGYFWLTDESNLELIEKLNKRISLDLMIGLLGSQSSRISAGAAIALGNYMALHRTHFFCAMRMNTMEVVCTVIADGAAEAKREAAILLGVILEQINPEDIQETFTENVMEDLFDALEMDDPELIRHLVVAFSVMLPFCPWIAELMLARDLDQFLMERVELGSEILYLHRTLREQRDQEID